MSPVRGVRRSLVGLLLTVVASAGGAQSGPAVRAWIDEVTIPTYRLGPADINPHFYELNGSLIYPYTMQDRFTTTRQDVTYRAVYLENEYLRVLCLPEIGGRIQSVYDKVTGQEMFYRNHVIRPGHIALRGAWVSGGIEWNRGPQGHTVTSFSPVDVRPVQNLDGSASLLIGTTEMNFRTHWQVRLTLHPAARFLDEQIKLSNPTDGFHPYYFWNNTAFPNTPATRFIYPMTLGTDHAGATFFSWPEHDGRDLSWLRNYPEPTSVFGYEVGFDFFGAYDVDRDFGIVQTANHHVLPGKKAWTWGQSDAGLVAQSVLTDDDGPYIEVQSGPLPTQNDFGWLAPGQELAWHEYWYPVSGLGDGFEFANRDLAVQRLDGDGTIEFRLAATRSFPGTSVVVQGFDGRRREYAFDLSPARTDSIRLTAPAGVERERLRYRISVRASDGSELLGYESPLSIPAKQPPATTRPGPETAETEFLRAQALDRAGNRPGATSGYHAALALDPRHTGSLVALASMALETGRWDDAREHLAGALARDRGNGWAWYLRAVVELQSGNLGEAIAAGYEASKYPATAALGHSIVGRARARQGDYEAALESFDQGLAIGGGDWTRLFENLLLVTYGGGHQDLARQLARRSTDAGMLRLVPYAVQAVGSRDRLRQFVTSAHEWVGEPEFAFIELANAFADVGLIRDAANLLEAALVENVPVPLLRPLPLYYLAYFYDLLGDESAARRRLAQAAGLRSNFVFPSRVETLAVLRHAIEGNPTDGRAHLYLGNLLAGFGRVDVAVEHWTLAVRYDPSATVAHRNLALAASREGDLAVAERHLREALRLRPEDQTYVRDLARTLRARGNDDEAIGVLEQTAASDRRADITLLLSRTYIDTGRHDAAIALLNAATFSSREGDTGAWQAFSDVHVARGIQRLERGSIAGALADFETALTYPVNLNAGRPHRPREARAQYWRGRALEAQGRMPEAVDAFQTCAAGEPVPGEQADHVALCRQRLEQGRGARPATSPADAAAVGRTPAARQK